MSEDHSVSENYTVKPGDCLKALAEQLHTTVEVLLTKPSQDLSSPATLNLTDDSSQIKLDKAGSIPLPKAILDVHKRVCDFTAADLIFVPDHPKTNNPAFVLFTKAGSEAFVKEAALLDKAIRPLVNFEKTLEEAQDENEAKAQQRQMTAVQQTCLESLNQLGLLEPFKGAGKQLFLTDKNDKEKWRLYSADTVVLKKNITRIKTSLHRFTLSDNNEVKGLFPHEQHWLDQQLAPLKAQTQKDREAVNAALSQAEKNGEAVSSYTVEPLAADYTTLQNRTSDLLNTILNGYEQTLSAETQQLNRLNHQADTAAKKAGFVWSERKHAYLTEEQGSIESLVVALQALRQGETGIDHTFLQQPADDSLAYKGSDLMAIWRYCASVANEPVIMEYTDLPDNFTRFFNKAMALNSHGYVLKEQCLSSTQLFAWNRDDTLPPDWLSQQTQATREQLEEGIFLDEKGLLAYEIGLYPCKVLLAQLKACINHVMQDLDIVLGDKVNKSQYAQDNPVKSIVKPLLKRELAVMKQITRWQQQAQKNAAAGNVSCLPPACAAQKTWSLLWEESQWRPERSDVTTTSHLSTNPHSTTLVEAWHNGRCRFIRNSWLLDEEQSLGQARVCNLSGADVDAMGARPAKKVTKEALKAAVASLTDKDSSKYRYQQEARASREEQEQADKGKDALHKQLTHYLASNITIKGASRDLFNKIDDSYGKVYLGLHNDPLDSDSPVYDVSAGAQFLRFTAGASVSAFDGNTLGDMSNKKMNVGGFTVNGEADLFHATCNGEVQWPNAQGWQCHLKYETTDDNEVHDWFFGALQLQGSIQLYGFAGVSAKLSTSLCFAQNDQSLGLSGTTPVTTDFIKEDMNASKPVIHGHYDDNTTAQQTGIQGNVDLFAGIEAGGMVTMALNWLPPKSSTWLTLTSGSAGGAFAAGLGASAKFLITLREGRLVFIASAELVAGPGFKGSLGFTVDPKAMSQFVEAMAKVTAQNNYRTVMFINSIKTGGEQHEDAYRYVNELLTAYFTTALSLAELAMMPLTLLAEVNQKLLDKKYAHDLAAYINSPINRQQHEQWFDNAFPETKGRLLYCLMQYPDLSVYWYEGQDYQRDVSINMQQRDAALNLITWLSQESHEAGSKQYRLMLMCCNPQGKKPVDEFEKFQAYGDTWGELQGWFYHLYQNFYSRERYSEANQAEKQFNNLTTFHQRLCPELNKYYNLYEYTTPMNSIQKFGRQAVVPQRRWLYVGPLKSTLTIEERFSRLGITCATLKLLKEGM